MRLIWLCAALCSCIQVPTPQAFNADICSHDIYIDAQHGVCWAVWRAGQSYDTTVAIPLDCRIARQCVGE